MSTTIAVNDLANAGDAIDFLVGRGIKASEAVEFVARVANLHKKPKAPKLPKLPGAPAKELHRLPDDFTMSDDLRQFAIDRAFRPRAIDDMWARFTNHYRGNGKTAVDWKAKWRTWVMQDVKWNTERGISSDSGRQDGNYL